MTLNSITVLPRNNLAPFFFLRTKFTFSLSKDMNTNLGFARAYALQGWVSASGKMTVPRRTSTSLLCQQDKNYPEFGVRQVDKAFQIYMEELLENYSRQCERSLKMPFQWLLRLAAGGRAYLRCSFWPY